MSTHTSLLFTADGCSYWRVVFLCRQMAPLRCTHRARFPRATLVYISPASLLVIHLAIALHVALHMCFLFISDNAFRGRTVLDGSRIFTQRTWLLYVFRITARSHMLTGLFSRKSRTFSSDMSQFPTAVTTISIIGVSAVSPPLRVSLWTLTITTPLFGATADVLLVSMNVSLIVDLLCQCCYLHNHSRNHTSKRSYLFLQINCGIARPSFAAITSTRSCSPFTRHALSHIVVQRGSTLPPIAPHSCLCLFDSSILYYFNSLNTTLSTRE